MYNCFGQMVFRCENVSENLVFLDVFFFTCPKTKTSYITYILHTRHVSLPSMMISLDFDPTTLD